MMSSGHAAEIAAGERFSFGENWSRFLGQVNEIRIKNAETSLLEWLGRDSLKGLTFLDAGSGSGLFSLAACRLGARVTSFDYDPQSVACTRTLHDRFASEDAGWRVLSGSVLDRDFLGSLGVFDIVYSWGVLHHTGQMWAALGNVVPCVAPGGSLFIAIYNNQGKASRYWTKVKRNYCSLPPSLRFLILWPAFIQLWGKRLIKDLLRLRPLESWRKEGAERGMSAWWDVVDWVGGYPFEVARPEEIFSFYLKRGFELRKLKTQAGDLGTNEFVFERRRA
jgi:2-polyprenyl-6-hydroxyphenyl methylase/3-demethylubiquinone-9 3-methyltransferase